MTIATHNKLKSIKQANLDTKIQHYIPRH